MDTEEKDSAFYALQDGDRIHNGDLGVQEVPNNSNNNNQESWHNSVTVEPREVGIGGQSPETYEPSTVTTHPQANENKEEPATMTELSFNGEPRGLEEEGAKIVISPSSTFSGAGDPAVAAMASKGKSSDAVKPSSEGDKGDRGEADIMRKVSEEEEGETVPLDGAKAAPEEAVTKGGQLMASAPTGNDDTTEGGNREAVFKDEEEGAGEEKALLGNEEDEGIEIQPVMTEDAYSLLYTAKPCTVTAFYAILVITLQAGMLGLTFWDLIKPGGETNGGRNRIGVPPGSTLQVMISQFLGMILTVMVMAADGDFVIGISQLIEGYDSSGLERFPNATWYRWLMTAVLQTISGSFLLIDSFILAMQSPTVIDLSLNLTALYFIQDIDEQAFNLGLTGMIATRIKEDCEAVQEWKHKTTPEHRRVVLLRKRYLVYFMLIALLIPYFVVVGRQAGGVYACQHLYIQFGGESYDPTWAHYSGRFTSQGNSFVGGDRKDSRNYYLDDATKTVQLAYCDSEEAWTISLVSDEDDHCDYIFKSIETSTFDVIEIAGHSWYYNSQGKGGITGLETKAQVTESKIAAQLGAIEAETGDVKVDWLSVVCIDCNEEICDPAHGTCSEDKEVNRCECKEGRYGINCEFDGTTCPAMALDQRTAKGLLDIPSASYLLTPDREYTPIPNPNLTLYDRFIYLPREVVHSEDELEQVDSYIVFTGRRFVFYGVPETSWAEGIRSNWTRKLFYEWFEEQDATNRPFDMLRNLTATSPNYKPLLFSSPANYGEDSYTFHPTGLDWVLATQEGVPNDVLPASPDDGQPTGGQLLCSSCNNSTNPCFNSANCSGFQDGETGVCECPDYYAGRLCERALNCKDLNGCYNNGSCDQASGLCVCNVGNYGRLCQYGEGSDVIDFRFCSDSCGWGTLHCHFTESPQRCECYSNYEGEFCEVYVNATSVNTTRNESSIPDNSRRRQV